MRAGPIPDHGNLALLAQNQEAELRPLLLRVHIRNFIESRRRDAATIASFEAIALGLFPLVPNDALADAARLLRGHDDVPAPVRAALAERLDLDEKPGEAAPTTRETQASPEIQAAPDMQAGPETLPDPEILPGPEIFQVVEEPSDLDIARDPGHRLSGGTLALLVERAVHDRKLAQALLARSEPTVFDRAALYRHADALTRITIRRDIEAALSSLHVPAPTGTSQAAQHVTRVAARGDLPGLIEELSVRLGVDPEPFDIDRPAGRELFVFALLAVGLDETECIKVLLLLGTAQSRSVRIIYGLARLAKSTPRAVAAYLVGHEKVAAGRDRPSDTIPARGSAGARTAGRGETTPQARRAGQTGRDQAPTAQFGHRR